QGSSELADRLGQRAPADPRRHASREGGGDLAVLVEELEPCGIVRSDREANPVLADLVLQAHERAAVLGANEYPGRTKLPVVLEYSELAVQALALEPGGRLPRRDLGDHLREWEVRRPVGDAQARAPALAVVLILEHDHLILLPLIHGQVHRGVV